jgi:hypothetical protein
MARSLATALFFGSALLMNARERSSLSVRFIVYLCAVWAEAPRSLGALFGAVSLAHRTLQLLHSRSRAQRSKFSGLKPS